MKKQRMTIDPFLASSHALERIDTLRVDATNEEEIAHQQATYEAEAMQDAAKFARRVTQLSGLKITRKLSFF